MNEKQQQEPFKQLGDRLRTIRQKLHESIAEVSGAVEVDVQTMQRIEQGHERPAEDILLLIINHYGMREDEAATLWQLAGYEQPHHNHTPETNDETLNGRSAILVMSIDPRVTYSDGVQVTASNKGVIIAFSQASGTQNSLTTSKIGMSREQAYAVIRTLHDALSRSEPRQLPGGPEPESQQRNL